MGNICTRYSEKLFLDCYNKFKIDEIFSGESQSVIEKCNQYIRLYFIDFHRKFYDENVLVIASTFGRNLDIVRKYAKLYEKGCEISDDDYEEFGVTKSFSYYAVNQFETRVYEDFSRKLKYIISQLKYGNETIKIEELASIGDLKLESRTYGRIMGECSYYVLSELTNNLTTQDLIKISGLGVKGRDKIVAEVGKIENGKYKFLDQRSLEVSHKFDNHISFIGDNGSNITAIMKILRTINMREATIMNIGDTIRKLKAARCGLDSIIKKLEQQNDAYYDTIDDDYGSASK